MNQQDRCWVWFTGRAAPAPLRPGNEVVVTQLYTVAPRAVTDRFDHDSWEVLRPRDRATPAQSPGGPLRGANTSLRLP